MRECREKAEELIASTWSELCKATETIKQHEGDKPAEPHPLRAAVKPEEQVSGAQVDHGTDQFTKEEEEKNRKRARLEEMISKLSKLQKK